MTVEIRPMVATDAVLVKRQASQRVQLGLERAIDEAEAAEMIEAGEAWTVWRGDAPIAMVGLRETFPHAQAVAWAVLSDGIGADHLAVTRHARARVVASPLPRIEAIVRTTVDVEAVLADFPLLDPGQLLEVTVAADTGPELKWARLIGLRPVAVLRKFGGASEPHVILDRIR